MKEADFGIESILIDSWDDCPIARKKLAEEFSQKSDVDLLIKWFDVVSK